MTDEDLKRLEFDIFSKDGAWRVAKDCGSAVLAQRRIVNSDGFNRDSNLEFCVWLVEQPSIS